MRNITISKGLDIPISGEVTDLEITKHITKKVAVLGKDYHDLKPTMLVKVGEKVIKGQKLLEDKKIPGLFLVAPISGEIIEINRGERRAFESLVIETDNNVEEIVFIDNLSSFQANKENVRDILIESGLSFLGLGAQPPMTSWGLMIKDHYNYIILGEPFLAIIPGLCIMLLVSSFMILGNSFRDLLDVKN